MDDTAQGWMNADEDVAVVSVNALDRESHVLMDVLFSESRPVVWEAAVIRFDPSRRHKNYRRYIDFLSDEGKLAAIAVLCPDFEMAQYAYGRLAGNQLVEERYESTDKQERRWRVLMLIDDGPFAAREIAAMSPEEQAAFFSEVPYARVARRLLAFLNALDAPEGAEAPAALAQARFIELASFDELMQVLRDNSPLHFELDAVERLLEINPVERFKFSSEDAKMLTERALTWEGEDNAARRLMDKCHYCYKHSIKMSKAGTRWDSTVHQAYSDDTGQKFTTFECPECGYSFEDAVARWQ